MKNYVIYCPHLNRDIRGLLNIVPYLQIWTGEQTPRGEDGCLQCHQAIVREAYCFDSPFVFVMEDDCAFTTHFNYGMWTTQIERALRLHYDVLVGGCTRTYDERVVDEQTGHVNHLIEVSAFHSAHCIVYFKSGYEKILQTVQPFDVSVGRCGCRVALTWPFVAVQRPAFSGILKSNVDYVPLYEAHEKRLGHALGLLEPHIPMAVY